MAEIQNGINLIFAGKSVYEIITEVVIPVVVPLVTFVLGIIVERKQFLNQITQKISTFTKQSGKHNSQSLNDQESGRDSISQSNATSITGPIFGNQTIYPPSATPIAANTENALESPNQNTYSRNEVTNTDYIINRLEEHSRKFKIPVTFKNNLIEVHKSINTNRNPDVITATYFSLFKGIMVTIFSHKNYCNNENVPFAISSLGNAFSAIEELMNTPHKQFKDVQETIEDFEFKLVKLLAYI